MQPALPTAAGHNRSFDIGAQIVDNPEKFGNCLQNLPRTKGPPMSFDIIVVKPGACDAERLNDVREVIPLGDAESVRRIFEATFPGATAGVFVNGEEYGLEVTLTNDPVGSAHLALRYGQNWSTSSCDQFVECLGELCRHLQCVAFAVSDNSRLAP
ncbi:hypothetical protein [Burkholderia stagnalis]|uniref:hypothetical protein n=1 Tax=Burkholderia stagnalis TaxID=1503054 RepID=UPI0012D94230|nr:hypothetical protein [Burkholderia stagnalis]